MVLLLKIKYLLYFYHQFKNCTDTTFLFRWHHFTLLFFASHFKGKMRCGHNLIILSLSLSLFLQPIHYSRLPISTSCFCDILISNKCLCWFKGDELHCWSVRGSRQMRFSDAFWIYFSIVSSLSFSPVVHLELYNNSALFSQVGRVIIHTVPSALDNLILGLLNKSP